MGWFGFLLLLAVIAGGIYFYQKLQAIEQEIRREQNLQQTQEKPEPLPKVVRAEVAPPIFKEQVELETMEEDSGEPLSLEESLLKVINDLPGLLQTELYALFPGEEKKRLQGLLLQFDRDGVIRREKKKNSYRVFPA